MSMKRFSYYKARSLEGAARALRDFRGAARVVAGGTDLLGWMKDQSLPVYPEILVDLADIPGLRGISPGPDHGLVIGALTTLGEVSAHPLVMERYPALAMAAGRVASPNLRNMGTIGGNLCQDIRCWYYRNPHNRFPCLRKGGGRCYAWEGDNRFHSIFGPSVPKGCLAVHISDTAPALAAAGARVKTSKRTMPVAELFAVKVMGTTCLDPDEILTEVLLPRPPARTVSAFTKFAQRPTIDFPVVNCAVSLSLANETVDSASIWLNAVHLVPRRAREAEELLRGERLGPEICRAAGRAAVSGAAPLAHNGYLVRVAGALVERNLLACLHQGERSGHA